MITMTGYERLQPIRVEILTAMKHSDYFNS